MNNTTLHSWDVVKKCYPEFLAYILGERNCILIDRSMRLFVKFESYRDINEHSIIIFRNNIDAHKFDKLLMEHGHDYAVGILLGYPDSIVEWFANSKDSEKYAAPGIYFRSWSMTCPVELISEAYNFYKNKYNRTSQEMRFEFDIKWSDYNEQ